MEVSQERYYMLQPHSLQPYYIPVHGHDFFMTLRFAAMLQPCCRVYLHNHAIVLFNRATCHSQFITL